MCYSTFTEFFNYLNGAEINCDPELFAFEDFGWSNQAIFSSNSKIPHFQSKAKCKNFCENDFDLHENILRSFACKWLSA